MKYARCTGWLCTVEVISKDFVNLGDLFAHTFRVVSLELDQLHNWPNSQFPECTCSISQNAPFRTEMGTFLFWMEHSGTWNRCILRFVKLVYSRVSYQKGSTRHAYVWQIGPFWQDTLEMSTMPVKLSWRYGWSEPIPNHNKTQQSETRVHNSWDVL